MYPPQPPPYAQGTGVDAHPEHGRWISSHKGRFLAGGWLWYVGGLLIASGVYGVVHLIDSGEVAEGMGPMIGFPIGGALLLVALARWKQRLEVYERGFVWNRFIWGTKSVRFADVKNAKVITTTSNQGVDTEAELYMLDGKVVVLPGSLSDVAQVANFAVATARAGATGGLTNDLVQALHAGQRVNYGNVILEPLGISWRGQSLAWNQITGVTVQFGDLVIEGFAAQPVRWQLGVQEVPSIEALQGVLRAARGPGG